MALCEGLYAAPDDRRGPEEWEARFGLSARTLTRRFNERTKAAAQAQQPLGDRLVGGGSPAPPDATALNNHFPIRADTLGSRGLDGSPGRERRFEKRSAGAPCDGDPCDGRWSKGAVS